MFKVKSKKQDYAINFRTEITEINSECLREITNGVKLPKHYAIVALCFKTNLFNYVAMLRSNKKNNSAYVVPLMAAANEEDLKEINVSIGDKLIIDRSALERGSHINLPTVISSTKAMDYFAADNDLAKAIMTKNPTGLNVEITEEELKENKNIIVMEFKIVPVNDISASVPVNFVINDPFKLKEDKAD